MLFSRVDLITDLFVWLDDRVTTSVAVGRPSLLSDSELLTILVWDTLVLKQKTIRDIYQWVRLYHDREFPHLPAYNNFLKHCHRLIPTFQKILTEILSTNTPLRFMDATMLPVCAHARADAHKVAKQWADFGKNWQGWHYGFKLHASIDPQGSLCAIVFSKASVFDGKEAIKLVNKHTKMVVADFSYGGKVLREQLWNERGVFVLAPPAPAHKTKIVAPWQHFLLSYRSKIESVFDYLKSHLSLVTSFPRSVAGYFFHYLRVLLSYQIMCLVRSGEEK